MKLLPWKLAIHPPNNHGNLSSILMFTNCMSAFNMLMKTFFTFLLIKNFPLVKTFLSFNDSPQLNWILFYIFTRINLSLIKFICLTYIQMAAGSEGPPIDRWTWKERKLHCKRTRNNSIYRFCRRDQLGRVWFWIIIFSFLKVSLFLSFAWNFSWLEFLNI